jgi:predicted DNA-binding transcriptional regulator AlpA
LDHGWKFNFQPFPVARLVQLEAISVRRLQIRARPMPSKKPAILKSGYEILTFADNTAVAVADPITRDAFDLLARGPRGPPILLTVQEVARLLRCSVSSLNKWRLTGQGPRFVRVGSRVRYRPTDIAAYVADQTRASTSAEKPPPA